MSKRIADVIFHDITKTYEDYEALYPPRSGSSAEATTRFAPSPTGFMHIGGLYTALINYLFTRQNGGTFFLRIEDTDQKRLVENGVTEIINTLKDFSILFDEGPANETEDYGNYGPYRQSLRRDIYQAFAKYLLEKDLAYPCFCTEEEIAAVREQQEQANALQKGYYGKWARCRELTEEQVLQNLADGKPYVIRLRSPGEEGKFRMYHDLLRGAISMPENIMDVVIIKQDGLPTYHFAHVVDDHLMRTSDVIRADEWIASLPLHVQMFEMLNFPVPRYTHLSPINKQEPKADGEGFSRRKLSKRKDPEARVHYYDEIGYPVAAVLDYLLTISSAAYEPWREENPDAPITDFPLDITRTGIAGALFDFNKLNSIARNRVGHMTCDEVYDAVRAWAARYDEKLSSYISSNSEQFRNSIHVWHDNRLDVAKWSDLLEMYPYLYDEAYDISAIEMPEKFAEHAERIPVILNKYLETFDYSDDSSVWFDKLRAIATEHNYAIKMGQYKKHPENFNGSIADVSSFVRFAITGCLNTPDLHQIIHVIGAEEAQRRVEAFCKRF